MAIPSSNLIAELDTLAGGFCENVLTAEQLVRLEQIVISDVNLRRRFILYMHIHSVAERELASENHDSLGKLTDAVGFETVISDMVPMPPSIRLELSPATDASTATSVFSAGGFLFSYAVAAVVVVVGMVVAWLWQFQRFDAPIEPPRTSTPMAANSVASPGFVARVTASYNPRWDSPDAALSEGSYLPIGRHVTLLSGLIELTYDSGARIILQGPCRYVIDASDGGMLTAGSLTAKVEKNPSAKLPHGAGGRTTLFAVRTPTAVVCDIGTEFSVDVDSTGTTQAHVFRGKIEMQASIDRKPIGQVFTLGENQSARVDSTAHRVVVAASSGNANRFPREIPKWNRLQLHNTGAGLRANDNDPHWQVVRVSGATNFVPRRAVVSKITEGKWLRNDPATSQWIAMTPDLKYVPNFRTYTFQTSFDLPGIVARNSIVLHGRFMADNHVSAIRLNGHSVPVPQHQYADFFLWRDFEITAFFVSGENVLEIDVFNGPDPALPTQLGKNTASPMLLRVELMGVRREAPQNAAVAPLLSEPEAGSNSSKPRDSAGTTPPKDPKKTSP